MENNLLLLRQGASVGLKKGWRSFLWMMKIIIPISFMTMLLAWSGWLHYLDSVLKPAMGLMNLPPAAALPLVIGMLTGVYGGIAAMVSLPFSRDHMTLIGIFVLTAHNLVQEGIVQGKSGINPWKATISRIGAATLTLILLSPWFSQARASGAFATAIPVARPAFLQALSGWTVSTGSLIVKAFLIIMAILTLLEILKTTGGIRYIIVLLAPVLRLMGLESKLALLWITAVVFGLAYGGAVIMEESKGGNLSREELERLHLSIGINHSMVEDTLLMVSLGLSAFWLYIPRLLMAIVAVRLLGLWQRIARKEREIKKDYLRG